MDAAEAERAGLVARVVPIAGVIDEAEPTNTEGMAIDLAIRQWARADDAAAAVAGVDTARLKNVAQLYRARGLASDEAKRAGLPVLLLHLGPE